MDNEQHSPKRRRFLSGAALAAAALPVSAAATAATAASGMQVMPAMVTPNRFSVPIKAVSPPRCSGRTISWPST